MIVEDFPLDPVDEELPVELRFGPAIRQTIVSLDLVGTADEIEQRNLAEIASIRAEIENAALSAIGMPNNARSMTYVRSVGFGSVWGFIMPLQAIQFVAAFQRLSAERNQARGTNYWFRSGIATSADVRGMIKGSTQRRLGTALVVATRLQESALPGHLLVDQATYDMIPQAERERFSAVCLAISGDDRTWDAFARVIVPDLPPAALLDRLLSAPHLHVLTPAVGGQYDREDTLLQLDESWKDPRTRVVSVVAPTGSGKTSLLQQWLYRVSKDRWRGARRVFAWSFGPQAPDDEFFRKALAYFGDDRSGDLNDAPARLAQRVAATRSLLILDNVDTTEPVGQLLRHLAAASGWCLCVATSRRSLAALRDKVDSPAVPEILLPSVQSMGERKVG